jgi:hypothetical protein
MNDHSLHRLNRIKTYDDLEFGSEALICPGFEVKLKRITEFYYSILKFEF